ncbi:MAG: alkaline phosphatase [Phycisphaeraceae bacterium]|nr:alkaline phosphatase [Phycisphaeraceae bacterium]MCW5768733.1 alkaline phosphatase [Phycisphaeraceae bacterium]
MRRRNFLKSFPAIAGAAGLVVSANGAERVRVAGGQRARSVIFMVSDGMSMGTLTLADAACRLRTGIGSRWVSLWNVPGVVRSSARTDAADSYVTDSAAAASAWGIGLKVNNGAVNITPEGSQPEPVLVTAKRAGLATGLVTTTRVTHATPAGFVANIPSRNQEREIALQILERRVDVVLGGGERYFNEAALASHADMTVARSAGALSLVPEDVGTGREGAGRLLGLFGRDHVPWVLDRTPSVPSLGVMTRAALDRLSRSDRGFLVQIEGGRVDHAAHDNDAGSLIAEQLDFDEAIGVALEYVARDPSILLIVTSDHGNGNPGLTLYEKAGNEGFGRLLGVRHSFEWIASRLAAARTEERPDILVQSVREATDVTLRDHEAEMVLRAANKERVDPFAPANSGMLVLGSVLANHFGVAFLSPNHTSDMVEVTAIGPGAERIGPIIDNTALYSVVRESLGI